MKSVTDPGSLLSAVERSELAVQTTVVGARALSAADLQAWARLQREDPTSDSPFFRPEFARTLAEARCDVEVGIVRSGDQPLCFFPFQRCGAAVGRPLAAPTSDFQGPIVRAGFALDLPRLLRDCGLNAWHFTDVVASKRMFEPFAWSHDDSPCVDLSQGFSAYQEQRRAVGSQTWRKTMQKFRKLERACGPVRFELATPDPRVLQELLYWKSQQCHARGHVELFAFDWTLQMLQRLLMFDRAEFSARLAAMYVGNELQAAFYCLQSHDVLHVWIIAHRLEASRYSPGYQLLARLIEHAGELGVRRIDLGRGGERFKSSFANSAIQVAEGSVDLRPVRRQLGKAWFRLRRCEQLRNRFRVPWRWAKRLRDQLMYR